MSILEIKQNIDTLSLKSKDDLINYVHELIIHEKRQDSKIISLKTELKYLERNLKKIRDMINKSISSKETKQYIWEKE